MSFASFPLEDLPLSRQQKEACQKAGFNFSSDVLFLSPGDVAKKTKLRYTEAQALVGAISKALTPRSWTVAELVDRQNVEQGIEQEAADTRRAEGWLGTGDRGLDQLLGGGLKIGGLTEITGESAAGKSHLCMSLAVAAQLPSLSPHPGGVVVLTSEREISTDRLVQLAQHHLSTFPAPGIAVKHILADIHSMRCAEVDDLENALKYQVPGMLASRRSSKHSPLRGERAEPAARDVRQSGPKPIKLLLLDSITALLRGSDALSSSSTSASSLAQRSKYLCSIADKLKALAVEHEIAVVVINQVTDVFSRPVPVPPPSLISSGSQFYTATETDVPMLYATQARWFSGQTETLAKEASLGIVWANAVNTRLMLSRTGRRRRINQDDLLIVGKGKGLGEVEDGEDTWADVRPTLIRRAHVVFSSHAPSATLDFVITSTGVHSLEESYALIEPGGSSSRKRRRRRSVDSDSAPPGDAGQANDIEGNAKHRWIGEDVIDDFGDLPAEFWDEAPSSPVKDSGAIT